MTSTPPPGPPRVQTRITVPDSKIMVNLLGAGDEILRLVERSVNSDVHVRGNEITITGAPADNALAERLFSELLELIEKGETLTQTLSGVPSACSNRAARSGPPRS